MDKIHVHKTKKSICAHFAESPCTFNSAKLVQSSVICHTAGLIDSHLVLQFSGIFNGDLTSFRAS